MKGRVIVLLDNKIKMDIMDEFDEWINRFEVTFAVPAIRQQLRPSEEMPPLPSFDKVDAQVYARIEGTNNIMEPFLFIMCYKTPPNQYELSDYVQKLQEQIGLYWK